MWMESIQDDDKSWRCVAALSILSVSFSVSLTHTHTTSLTRGLWFIDDLTVYLHLTISHTSPESIQIRLSEDATSDLKKGMMVTHVKVTDNHRMEPVLTPNGEAPLQSAIRILKSQAQLEDT
jgi:hypothetical protein